MHCIDLHENRTMKPVEIVLSGGGDWMRENDGQGESNQGTL
jgi:hypothetical protein